MSPAKVFLHPVRGELLQPVHARRQLGYITRSGSICSDRCAGRFPQIEPCSKESVGSPCLAHVAVAIL
jgi:hypothetical protein